MSTKFRLYPTPEQEALLSKFCWDARTVWNLGLAQRKFYKQPFPEPLDYNSQSPYLRDARKDLPWLGEGSSVVQQQALKDLEQAFQNFFNNPFHFSFPKFRKKGQSEGFRIVNVKPEHFEKTSRRWGTIRIPKIGDVPFKLCKGEGWGRVPTDAKSFRVKMDRVGDWTITFAGPQPEFEREQTGAVVGLDMGVVHGVTTSDGVQSSPCGLKPGEQKRLKRLQQKLARQQKGSEGYETTRKKIAKLKRLEKDRRNDWIEQETTKLVRDNDVICVEALQVKQMTKSAKGTVENPGKNVSQKRGLNRGIQGVGWTRFLTRLSQKAEAATSECQVIQIPAAFTSLKCSNCKHVDRKNRKNQAEFSCQSCGLMLNADLNAAKNIRADGLVVLGRGAKIRPEPVMLGEGTSFEASTTKSELIRV